MVRGAHISEKTRGPAIRFVLSIFVLLCCTLCACRHVVGSDKFVLLHENEVMPFAAIEFTNHAFAVPAHCDADDLALFRRTDSDASYSIDILEPRAATEPSHLQAHAMFREADANEYDLLDLPEFCDMLTLDVTTTTFDGSSTASTSSVDLPPSVATSRDGRTRA